MTKSTLLTAPIQENNPAAVCAKGREYISRDDGEQLRQEAFDHYDYELRDLVEYLSRRAEAIAVFQANNLHEFAACKSSKEYFRRIGLPVKLAAMIEDLFGPSHPRNGSNPPVVGSHAQTTNP